MLSLSYTPLKKWRKKELKIFHIFNKAEKKGLQIFHKLTKLRKRRTIFLSRCEAALNSEWSTVVKEARWILHKILGFFLAFFWTNRKVWVLLFLLVFLHQGCWIRWTAWTACIWRPWTARLCKPYLRTEQRTLAGPLQVFKKRLIRRHVDVSQSY